MAEKKCVCFPLMHLFQSKYSLQYTVFDFTNLFHSLAHTGELEKQHQKCILWIAPQGREHTTLESTLVQSHDTS